MSLKSFVLLDFIFQSAESALRKISTVLFKQNRAYDKTVMLVPRCLRSQPVERLVKFQWCFALVDEAQSLHSLGL